MKNSARLSTIFAFVSAGLLGLNGCLRPLADAPRGKTPAGVTSPRPKHEPTPEEEAARIEEIAEEKAGEKIIEESPDREMSRQEIQALAERYREESLREAKELEAQAEAEKTEAGNEVPKAESKTEKTVEKTVEKVPEKKSETKTPAPTLPPVNVPQPKAPTAPKKEEPVPTKKSPTTQPSSNWPTMGRSTEKKVEEKTVEKPATKKPAPTELKTPPVAGTGKKPKITELFDIGIDAEDETRSQTYVGPKEAVFRAHSTADRQLSQIAAELAKLGKSDYQQIQKDSLGTKYSACNFFVITALLGAKVADENRIPMFTAAAFPEKYLEPKGWEKIDVATLKNWLREGRSFDAIIQRDPPKGKIHGHIAIPVGLNEAGDLLVAEGVLGKVTNRIRVYTAAELTKYRVYVRR
jgi:hypothetical protein